MREKTPSLGTTPSSASRDQPVSGWSNLEGSNLEGSNEDGSDEPWWTVLVMFPCSSSSFPSPRLHGRARARPLATSPWRACSDVAHPTASRASSAVDRRRATAAVISPSVELLAATAVSRGAMIRTWSEIPQAPTAAVAKSTVILVDDQITDPSSVSAESLRAAV